MNNIQKVANELYEGAFLYNEECDTKTLELEQGTINNFEDEAEPARFFIQYEGQWYTVSVEETK
ncbi:hypothetical protein D3C85_630850 [compost metagenome]